MALCYHAVEGQGAKTRLGRARLIYLLSDGLLGTEKLAELKAEFPDEASRELNTSVLDGQKLALGDLVNACEAMPFLADRRMVVVNRLLARFEPRAPKQDDSTASEDEEAPLSDNDRARPSTAFADYMPRIPQETICVLVEPRQPTERNPLWRALRKLGVKPIVTPKLYGAELRRWIEDRVRKKGGKITGAAAEQLGAYLSSDLRQLDNELRQLDNELEKLVTYAGTAPIGADMVQQLVADAREANIFALTDALGSRQVSSALSLLHKSLADGEPPPKIMVMLARQFRLLLQFKELRSMGLPPDEIGRRLQVQPFVVNKLAGQARRFTTAQLEAAYDCLLDADVKVKTGRLEPDVALDLLVTEIAPVQAPGTRR